MENDVTLTVSEGLYLVRAALIGKKLAERSGNIFLQRQYGNAFEFFIRGLEESRDLSMHAVAKPYRRLMEELN